MLRRSVLALSNQRVSIRRFPRQGSIQIPSPLCLQREFSSASQQNATPGLTGSNSKPSGSTGNLSKVVFGSVALGTCLIIAYSRGYLDDVLGKTFEVHGGNKSRGELPKNNKGSHDFENNGASPVQAGEKSAPFDVENTKESSEKQSVAVLEDSGRLEGESKFPVESSVDDKPKEEYAPVKEEKLPIFPDDMHVKEEEIPKFPAVRVSSEDENLSFQKSDVHMNSFIPQTSSGQHEVDEKLPTFTEVNAASQGNKMNKDVPMGSKFEDEVKDMRAHEQEAATSLLETYNLADNVDDSSTGHNIKQSSSNDKSSGGASRALSDVHVSKDGKLILDFLQAIHAAEQAQAELDARVFTEEKRAIKDKFEKELKDARARELMYAEEAAMLEKDLEKERAKAAATLKSLQEKAEERLKMELEEKERESQLKLKELQELAKAELAASLAREKAAQVEKMAETNLNINALCMAFYARSEEALQTYSMHKLALGALALEDALSNGLPIQDELESLQSYIESVDKDSLLQLALSSLPEDVRIHGTDSPLQLNEKFDKLKGPLRHFSLIPPNGGGILAHSLAYVASFLKVKEVDQSGDGIESVINKVESLLAKGKLVEAADALENGVKGSKAAEIVSEWLRRARNRAITEQALVLLQSYAASVSP